MSKIEQQQERFEKIKTLCLNYRKDGASRKTPDYLRGRLTSLDALWGDFENQHLALLAQIEDKNILYFTGNVYEKTKAMYESTKADMQGLLNKLSGETTSVKFDLSELIDDENGNETKRLLNKQERNFKAIDRAMSKITVTKFMEKWELEDNLNILKSKWTEIDRQHWELDDLLTGESHVKYYDMFINMENKYDEMRKKLNTMMWSTTHYQHVAPRIEIPEFSGQYNHWMSFKDLFIETIHNNPTINKAQKMQHLKTKLRGEAERLVQHLTISAENYNSCWDILNQRYDNRRLQFISFMNAMMHLPTIQQPDAFNLKKMHDVITECLSGLNNIGLDTSTWDPIIVYLMAQKLDSSTHNEYVKELQNHREVPALQDFLFFLESKFMAYETMRRPKNENVVYQQKPTYNKPFQREYTMKKPYNNFNKNYPKTYYATYGQCPFCNGSHVLMQCAKFIALDVPQRNNTVAKLRLCKNCLFSHGDKECTSTKTCKECNMKHHSLLHNDNKISTMKHENNNFGVRPSTSTQPQHINNHHLATKEMEVLLTTVQLQIQALDGSFVTLRALLDQGSQINIITENAAQLLRLPRRKLNATISGIGELTGNCRGKMQLTCKSLHSDFTFETEALILTKLTNNLPNASFNKVNWPHLENLKLADADFNVSRPVDMLLGADVYADILMDGVLRGDQHSPIAQQTHLGWILCGKLTTKLNCHVTLINMNELTKFWENEDVLPNNDDISENEQCEQYYTNTTQRDENGQYIVKIPIHENIQENLGKSKQIAISQFLQLEKRLERQETLRKMYKEFINEYIELQHMTLSPPSPHLTCYLPHHGVLRENATSTKLRVVFTASQKTTSGQSLNNLQEKGPSLQKDIQTLIHKWRSYQFAFVADIENMYRCIWISEDQQQLQKIIWRNSPSETLQEYKLRTVTYGMKSAPWLAMRTLKQLAIDDGHKYPEAAKILQNEFYVDDLISGYHTTEQGTKSNEETALAKNDNLIIELLQSHGSLTRVIRVTAWILRFSANARNNKKCNFAYLTTNELITARQLVTQNVYKGHIDVHLVTPVNLFHQLNDISGKLPRTLSLPVNIRKNLKDIYQLLYVKARVTENFFLFEMHIPLISDEDFALHHVIPLPVKTTSATGMTKTSSKYIAVNLEKNTYISPTEDDLKQCVQLKPGNFICNKNMPIYNLHNNDIPCEAALLSHRANAVTCDVASTSCSDAWIELHTPNAWLAICCETCALRTICEDDITSHTIKSSGIVKVAQECMIQSKHLTIHSHNQYNSKVKMDYYFNVPTLDSSVNKIVNISNYNFHHFEPTDTEDITKIQRRIDSLKENERQLPDTLSTHDIHQYAVCYSLVGAAIIASILVGVRRYCLRHLSTQTQRSKCSLQSVKTRNEDIELQIMSHTRSTGAESTPAPATRNTKHVQQHPVSTDNIAFDFD